MVAFRTTLLALATATAVSADYWIDPNSVPLSTRQNWCQSELSTCPLICQQVEPQTTLVNTCDPVTLSYGCLCGNNLQPNVSEYSLTLPYFVCTEWGTQCVKQCGSDNTCASACRQDHPCGAQRPKTNYTTTTTSSTADPTGTAEATTTANQVFSGIAGSATTTASTSGQTNTNAGAALEFGRGYGLVVVAGSLFAGFAMML
ncbi:hypothetical protein CONLIGDRAFT_693012 [Coniochaeta ligniaria NRRL 30616]|uniref:DUF7707 domain-containing protein n=1 Tax=Coniochaeta ligniaria NRRL 30616 TaxID=1408157 RepID=A0A1J7I9R0_9PEZI|nr:hypothetical protein CONLIGDRAFT_693012 [Coniochaeta ligniaria NRRL 30616]